MSDRNRQIEGLRGIAIIMVVVFHLFSRVQQIYFDSDIYTINWLGIFGPELFIVISAFFLGKGELGKNIFSYYRHKLIRLWPTYFIAIVFIFVITHIYSLPNRTVNFSQFCLNVPFINGYIGTPYVDSAHWYMTTLVSFILITGIIKFIEKSSNTWTSESVKKLIRGGALYIIWMGMGLLTKLAHAEVLYKLLGGSYIGLAACGALISHLIDNKGIKILGNDIYKFASLAISIAYTFATVGIQYVVFLLIIIPSFVLAYYKRIPWLDNKVLEYIGEASFSIFLIHQNIGFVIELYLHQLLNFNEFNIGIGVFCFCLVVALGIVFHRFIEKPLMIVFTKRETNIKKEIT